MELGGEKPLNWSGENERERERGKGGVFCIHAAIGKSLNLREEGKDNTDENGGFWRGFVSTRNI